MAEIDVNASGTEHDLPDVEERFNRMWRRMMGHPFRAWTGEGLWHPALDIYRTEDSVLVEVELPGMKERDIQLTVEAQHLVVRGSRPSSPAAESAEPAYRERPVGDFHRVVHLPFDVDTDRSSAEYDDGVLTVHLPRKAREEAKKIEIR
jgi:HSP20 family protein